MLHYAHALLLAIFCPLADLFGEVGLSFMRHPDFERLKTVFAQFPQIQERILHGQA